jgi:hypothetical protein
MKRVPRMALTHELRDVPEEFQQPVLDMIRYQIMPIAPRWLRHVAVIYDTTDVDGLERIAAIECHHEYREAKLFLYPQFFALDYDRRHQAIIHEMVHMYTAALEQFTNGLVLDRDESEHATLSRLRDVALEISVDDIAELIVYLMKHTEIVPQPPGGSA